MALLPVETAETKARGSLLTRSVLRAEDREEQVVLLLAIEGKEKEGTLMSRACGECLKINLLAEEGDPALRFEGALKQLNGILKGASITGSVKHVDGMVAFEEEGGSLHLSNTGEASAYLIRRNTTVQVTEEEGPMASPPAFLHISSGTPHENDFIVLSTSRLLRVTTPAQMSKLALRPPQFLEELRSSLERERQAAVLALLHAPPLPHEVPPVEHVRVPPRRGTRRGLTRDLPRRLSSLCSVTGARLLPLLSAWRRWSGEVLSRLQRDLQHPVRRRRAHLLLLASSIAIFLVIWTGLKLTTTTQRSKTRQELEHLVQEVTESVGTASARHLMGDLESAHAILRRAEENARSVMGSESGLFRKEALDLLTRIQEKREEISAIVRITPTVAANLASKQASISARGLVVAPNGELLVYDHRDTYAITLNSISGPSRLQEDDLILLGTPFQRYGTSVFLMKGGTVLELSEGTTLTMKTDDPAGWLTGTAAETYLRFLYLLSPANNQIYKYERLSNRYGPPAEYNINGDLREAVNFAIDGDIYVLSKGGQVTKLLRGEIRPFTLRNLPEESLDGATRILKPSDTGNFYFLDPTGNRIVITGNDGELGESLYRKQYVLRGDQVGQLQDIAVDAAETTLYVLDEKHVYAIDLQEE